MKYIVNVFRVIVGVAFILSGLIKLNDPLGFSYKLEEYFSAEVLNLPFLIPLALAIALFVVVYEVVLGVFLLIGFKPKLTLWSLIAMIIFFTFLTFYSAYFDKVKDCGCFGDAIKLSPWGSFTKDLIFLALLLPIYFGLKHIKPLFKAKVQWVIALGSILLCAWFGYYVLNHLPVKDFRPYRVGANITEGMTVPDDAPKDVIDYHWLFNVNGEEKIITTQGSYPTVDGEFISVETEIIKEGFEPAIYDFSIESEDGDFTETYLNKENVVMIVSYSLEKISTEGAKAIKTISDKAKENGYTVIGLSASGRIIKERLNKDYNFNFQFYLCDEKALKAVVRSNPGVLVLNKGTVMQKVHWKDIDELKLPKINTSQVFTSGKKIKIHEDKILYVVNGKKMQKHEVDTIAPDDIESIIMEKDSIQIAKYTTEPYESLIRITLKERTN